MMAQLLIGRSTKELIKKDYIQIQMRFNEKNLYAIKKQIPIELVVKLYPKPYLNEDQSKIYTELLQSDSLQNEIEEFMDDTNNFYHYLNRVKNKGRRGEYHVRTKTRNGQDIFSKQVKKNYNYTCAISGVVASELLEAAHIVPWRTSISRLDVTNGICMNILFHKAFDTGYFVITDDYKVHLTDKAKNDPILFQFLSQYDGNQILLPKLRRYYPKREYLKNHRELVGRESDILIQS